MKKCNNCGFDNVDDALFCGKCGLSLTDEHKEFCPICGAAIIAGMSFCIKCGYDLNTPPKKTYCAVCGAEIGKGMDFCVKCGTKAGTAPYRGEPITDFSDSPKCPECGAVLEKDSAFCLACGYRLSPASGPTRAETREKSPARVKFDKHSHYIVNAFIIALAAAFMLVALLCPVKIRYSLVGVSDMAGDSSVVDTQTEKIEINQSPWQILGTLKYISLDKSDPETNKIIQRFQKDMTAAVDRAGKEYKEWAALHKTATEEEQQDKAFELMAEYMSDINMLGYEFVYTTIGAANIIEGDTGFEDLHIDELIVERDFAIIGLITGLVAVAVQLGVAVLSLVFLILAIVGMVKKKPFGVLPFALTVMIMTMLGLLTQSASIVFVPGGAMLALAITATSAYFAFGLTKAVLGGKHPAFIAKRVVTAAFLIPAFFLLCTDFINVDSIAEANNKTGTASTSAALGGALEAFISTLEMRTSSGVKVVYSDASAVNSVVTLALGALAFVFILVATVLSLVKLVKNTEKNDRVDILALLGAVMLIALAIAPAIINSVDKSPITTDIGIKYEFGSGVFVYVAMALAIAAFVFEIVYNAGKFAGKTVSPAPLPESVTDDRYAPQPAVSPAAPVSPQEQLDSQTEAEQATGEAHTDELAEPTVRAEVTSDELTAPQEKAEEPVPTVLDDKQDKKEDSEKDGEEELVVPPPPAPAESAANAQTPTSEQEKTPAPKKPTSKTGSAKSAPSKTAAAKSGATRSAASKSVATKKPPTKSAASKKPAAKSKVNADAPKSE